MKPNFKTYGYISREESAELKEIPQVSLCFEGLSDVEEFSSFIKTCLEELRGNPDWNHEHFLSSNGDFDIILSMLDKQNY